MAHSIIHSSDISHADLLELFILADDLRAVERARNTGLCYMPKSGLHNRVMGTLFLEPSLRTRFSFEAAMNRLGGRVISAAGQDATSASKGESMSDMILTASCYCDVLVVRSGQPVSAWNYPNSHCPLINAGDGGNNHPTQMLTDMYTVWRHFRCDKWTPMPRGANIGVIGDLSKSRAIRSFVQKAIRQNPGDIWAYDSTGYERKIDEPECFPKVEFLKSQSQVLDRLPEVDILYINRVQTERWMDGPRATIFRLDEAKMKLLKGNALVLNPGPRTDEMPDHLDSQFHQIRYADQTENGMYVRMALLTKLLSPTAK